MSLRLCSPMSSPYLSCKLALRQESVKRYLTTILQKIVSIFANQRTGGKAFDYEDVWHAHSSEYLPIITSTIFVEFII